MMLSGKKIIVTGGSRGIGQATVKLLCSQGAKVAWTRTSQPHAGASEGSTENSDSNNKAFGLNLTETASFKDAVASMVDYLGGLDGVVNNAGIAADNLMLRMKESEYDRTLDTNLKGAYFFTKECLRPLLKNESGGSIVFVSSVVGLMGNSGQTAYSASKAGMVGLAKSLARELASRQVRSNVIAPGFIETDMTAALDESAKTRFLEQIPLGRLGTAEEIGQGVAYLLSDMSRYVTGQILNINGGLYI
jgi:3-oxoacyl-[acyl-carrier protein] reductase